MGATHGHERPGRAQLAPDQPPPRPAETRSGPPDEPPALIAGRYRLVARVHASGAGTLYQAEDVAFSRAVALRILTPALSRDESVLARLQARLEASATINRDDLGADLVELTDLGRADSGHVFVVTEFLAGDSLATQLAREGPLPWRTLRPLMVRACQLIHLSHQHGVLRLDLQTRHFFPIRDKTRTSTLKILSTGIGDVFGDSLWSSLSPAAAAAHLRYAAPEQITGGNVDARTDVYTLGVIMYELLVGRVPFPDARPAYLCARHLLEPAPPLFTGAAGEVPEAVAAIVARALAKAPEDRWPTMRALANAMAAIEFGPCDASGVLEVVDALPIAPTASSTSMRIDPTARHAPSPTVRPKTMPPLRDAFRAEPPEAPERVPAPTGESPVLSTSPDPRAHGSSSTMAWEEILAAADEAIAVVAVQAASGTAGDSGVFIPERLIRTGAAATASMTRARLSIDLAPAGPEPDANLDPASSQQPTLVRPRSEILRATAAEASTTMQLSAADLGDIDDPAAASNPARPLLAARPPPCETAATAGTAEQPTPPDGSTTGLSPIESATASADSLRAAVDRSSVWPIAGRSQPAPRPTRRLAWAAAALIMLGGAAAGIRSLRPPEAAPPPSAPAATPPRAVASALPAAIAHPRALSPATETLTTATGTDLTEKTGAPPARQAAPTQWPRRPDAGPQTSPGLMPATPPAASPTATSPTPEPAAAQPAVSPPPPAQAAAAPPEPPAPIPSPRSRPTAPTSPRPTTQDPPRDASATPTTAPRPRKSAPGAHLPDAGHELAAAIEADPMRAASLLGAAEQAAARGEQTLALSLAIQSYHAQPSNNALTVAGKQACKLGDREKARWARLHLPPEDRGPVDTACATAGLNLE